MISLHMKWRIFKIGMHASLALISSCLVHDECRCTDYVLKWMLSYVVAFDIRLCGTAVRTWRICGFQGDFDMTMEFLRFNSDMKILYHVRSHIDKSAEAEFINGNVQCFSLLLRITAVFVRDDTSIWSISL